MNPIQTALLNWTQRRPKQVAVLPESGPPQTWADLATSVEDIAARFPRGETIALALSSGPAFISALLAACSRECHAVLLNPRWTASERESALKITGASLVVSDLDQAGERWDGGLAGLFSIRTAAYDTRLPRESDPSIILFTSGTTGHPLAVPRTQQQFWREANAYSTTLGLSAEDRVATLTPLCHAYALVDGMLGALAVGATLQPLSNQRAPRDVLGKLAEHHASVVIGVPALYQALAQIASPAKEQLSNSVRLLISAGSPLNERVRKHVAGAFAAPLYNLYGTTETGTVAFQTSVSDAGAGRPMPGLRVEVREGDRILPTGRVGEVHVYGDTIAKGYAGGWCPELFSLGGVDTRDRGWLDESGSIHIVGRRGDVINVAGNKVDPLEVEEHILGLPGVEDVVVVPVASPQGDRVAAVIRASRHLSLAEINEMLSGDLAAYKLPRLLYPVEQIPRGPTGKVSRALVARRLAAEPVAVIVVTCQLLGHTRRCLESLLKTDYPALEIVIIDNGSTDGTQEFLLDFRSQAARAGIAVQLGLLSANRGAAHARNIGAKLSTSPLLGFVDNDTTFPHRDWLSRLVNVYRQDEHIGIVGPQLLYPFHPHAIQHAGGGISPNGRVGELGRGEPADTPEFNVARDVQFLTTACWLMSRDVFTRAGGFCEEYHPYYFEEIDLCYRVKSLGYRLRYEPTCRVHHYENASASVLGLNLARVVARNQHKFKLRWHGTYSREGGPSPECLKFRSIPKPPLEDLPDVLPPEDPKS